MPVAASDLILYGSANMPESDSGSAGGAIDLTTRVIPDSYTLFNSISVNLAMYSSNGADTMNVTVYGRLASGTLTSETKALSGLTPVLFTTDFTRLEKIVLASTAAGTVSIVLAPGTGTDPADTVVDIESGVTTIRRMFYSVAADIDTGSTRTYYEKCFLKNTHGSLAALGLAISEASDPSGQFDFALEDAADDNESVADRTTAPTGITGDGFSSTAKNIPDTDLDAGSAQGIWLKLTLPAGDTATVTTLGLQFDAQSVA